MQHARLPPAHSVVSGQPRRVRVLRRLAFGLVPLAGLMASSCKGCGEDKPYTPFSVAASVPAKPPEPPDAGTTTDAATETPSFEIKTATKTASGATTLTLDSGTLQAPSGRVFELSLSTEIDGTTGVVAWTLPETPAPDRSPGELWFFGAGEEPRLLSSLPGFVPTFPSCRHDTRLSQTGPRSVTLDVHARCETELVERSPVRAILVLAPNRETPLLLGLRVADPAPAEEASYSVDSQDRDGDGRDDIQLEVKVARQKSARPATGRLVWLDRAAGLSRDSTEPRQSLARAASLEAVRAKGKNTSLDVPDALENMRRWIGAVCGESGTSRLLAHDGATISCGEVHIATDRMTLAEVRAALTQGDPQEAVAALSHAEFFGGALHEDMAESMLHDIGQAISIRKVTRAKTLVTRPLRRSSSTQFSPMRFLPDDSLLIQTPFGLMEVAADAEDEAPLDQEAGVKAWPLEVVVGTENRWVDVTPACDRAEILLAFRKPDHGLTTQPTRLLAPRPGRCGGGSAPPLTGIAPLSIQDGRLEALVAGSVVGPRRTREETALRAVAPGSARSPDGRVLVAVSELGLFVGREKPELWRLDAVRDTVGKEKELGGCVVANDGRKVACLTKHRAVWIPRPE